MNIEIRNAEKVRCVAIKEELMSIA